MVKIEYFSEDDASIPANKTTRIIRKSSYGEVAEVDIGMQIYCPVADRFIESAECIEISDVADEMINPRIFDDYKEPID